MAGPAAAHHRQLRLGQNRGVPAQVEQGRGIVGGAQQRWIQGVGKRQYLRVDSGQGVQLGVDIEPGSAATAQRLRQGRGDGTGEASFQPQAAIGPGYPPRAAAVEQ